MQCIYFITNIIMISLLLLILIIPYQIQLHNFKELEDIYIKADVNFDKIESGSMETP